MSKIKSFIDLHAWQEGHKLAISVYKIIGSFPDEERYGIVNQMRRCAVSITSNLAEGFSRKCKKESAQFFYFALGSITEFQNQLLLSRDIGYLSKVLIRKLANQIIAVSKLANGLIKSSKFFT